MSRTKFGIITLVSLFLFAGASRLVTGGAGFVLGASKFSFEFNKVRTDARLESIISDKLRGVEGNFAVYVETVATDSAKQRQKFALNELEPFPAASLYKLILMAAVLKEVEKGNLKFDDKISGDKEHLTKILGSVDFGYEERSDSIQYTIDEALARVGRISDNFAAIMLTEKLRQSPGEGLLYQMVGELGMNHTDFASDPIQTTASDIATFFKALYRGKVVSQSASGKIMDYLGLSKINNRIPAGLPEGVKVIHKTGELSRIRHDAGIVFLEGNPYVIVLLSKNLKYEDEGVRVFAEVSKEVYEYVSKKP